MIPHCLSFIPTSVHSWQCDLVHYMSVDRWDVNDVLSLNAQIVQHNTGHHNRTSLFWLNS